MANNNHKQAWDDSLLEGENAEYLEMLYEQYQESPESLDTKWQAYFSGLEHENFAREIPKHSLIRKQFRANGLFHSFDNAGCVSSEILEDERQQVRVLQLIESFRFMGHLSAHTNPLNKMGSIPLGKELSLEHHHLQKTDPNKIFHLGSFNLKEKPTLDNIYRALKNTYTACIGAEYMHIMNTTEKEWIQRRLELCQSKAVLTTERKQAILRKLIAAESFEQYLHKRYIGQKRFSL